MTERPFAVAADRIADANIDPPPSPAPSDVKEDVTSPLLGLSTAEQRLYETLLTRPPLTPSDVDDLAADFGWDSDRTHAVLDRLRELRLVTRLATNPPRLTVAPPYNALNARLDTHSHGLTRAHQRMLDLSARFHTRQADRDAEIAARAGHLPAAADTEHGYGTDPLVTVVRGREAITRLLEGANRSIRHEVLSLDSPPYFGNPRRGNIVRTDDRMAGVRYRIVYDPRALAVPEVMLGLVQTERREGHAYRVADIPVKMTLIDGRLGLMPLDHRAAPIEAFLVIGDPALLAALRALFEVCWQRAVPVFMRGDAPVRELSDSDRELLVLLTAGHTDRAIAERMGWHERTSRRRVAELMRRIGADTRFQAGYRAVVDGWLQPDAAIAAALAAAARSTTASSTPDTGVEPDGTPRDVERP